MSKTLLTCVLSMVLLSAAYTRADNPSAQPPSPVDIPGLIKQLGSTKFGERERAKKALEQIGSPAYEPLKQASKSDDPEVSQRASELVKKLESKVLAAKVLTPRRVHLNVKDVSVLDAITELSKQSGYPIQVQGDRNVLASRKITIDTGSTTFWQAFDQLCQKAELAEMGLTQQLGSTIAPTDVHVQPLPVRPPIRIQPVQPGQRVPLPVKPVQILPVQPIQPVPQVLPVNPIQILPAQPANGAIEIEIQVQPLPAQVQPLPVQAQPIEIKAVAPAILPVAPPQQAPNNAQPNPAPLQPNKAVAQPVKVKPVFAAARPAIAPRPQPGPLQLTVQPGKFDNLPTVYAGALRLRLTTNLPPGTSPAKPGEVLFGLQITAEPGLGNFSLVGSPTVEKAIDDQNQELSLVLDMNPANPNDPAQIHLRPQLWRIQGGMNGMGAQPGVQVLRLKKGSKAATMLTELKGNLSLQMLAAAEPLITVPEVLRAAGKTFKGTEAGSITISAIEKQGDDYRVAMQMEMPPGGNPFGGNVQIMGGGGIIIRGQVQINGNVIMGGNAGNTQGMPTLLDKQGRAYQLGSVLESSMQFNNGQMKQNVTLLYRPSPGAGEPEQMVLNGQRPVTVAVPFRFEKVTLP